MSFVQRQSSFFSPPAFVSSSAESSSASESVLISHTSIRFCRVISPPHPPLFPVIFSLLSSFVILWNFLIHPDFYRSPVQPALLYPSDFRRRTTAAAPESPQSKCV